MLGKWFISITNPPPNIPIPSTRENLLKNNIVNYLGHGQVTPNSISELES